MLTQKDDFSQPASSPDEEPRQSGTSKNIGGCFCGEIEIEATGEPVEMGYCHCSSCRHYSGGPMSAFTLWRADDVRVTRGAGSVGSFNKMGLSDRHFCTKCGGHLFTLHPGMGFTDVAAGVLPTVEFRPEVHLNYAETVLPLHDGLPKLKDFPAHAGGSGDIILE